MLSDQERRTLQEIEQQIAEDDPRFVASMQRLSPGRVGRGHDVIISLAASSAVLCLVLSSVGAAFVAAGLVAVTVFLRPRRNPIPFGRRRRRPGRVTDRDPSGTDA